MKFNLVAVAGTFDHLHLGHQQLLEAAQQTGRKVFVGLCQQSMLRHKTYKELIENYSLRQKTVSGFLKDKQTQFFPLIDIYGPARTIPSLNAIICTSQTKTNVDKINHLRCFKHLKPLTPIIVNLVKSSDQKILSSTRIRQGVVNRQGFAFSQIFQQQLTLPAESRRFFKKPFAPVIAAIPCRPKFLTVSVGDIAAISLLKQKITPDLAIVDLKTKRRQIFSNLSALGLKTGLLAQNPPGTITADLAKKILSCLSQKIPTLLVKGEEDLAVLPTILLSPLKTTIFYGQPNQGIVKIMVTEKTKAKAQNLLTKFI